MRLTVSKKWIRSPITDLPRSKITRFIQPTFSVTTKEQQESAIRRIQDDLVKQVEFFKSIGDGIKAQRIKERVEYDMEMIKELGHCSGIENYSRYFDGRHEGERPYCLLLDFFPKDFLLVVDESHVSIPQIGAMYGGDRARKKNLVRIWFPLTCCLRQPSAEVRGISRSHSAGHLCKRNSGRL